MNIPSNFWKTATGFIGILILLAIVILIKQIKSIGYVGVNTSQPNTITVDGTGDAFAQPDVATFSFTVTDTEKAVSDAQAKVTTEVNAALAVVKNAGVADADISTDSYSINPHYEYQNAVCPAIATADSMPVYCPSGKQTLTGYDVSESVSVKLRDLTKAGSLLTALGGTGVTNLNGPSFEVDNPDMVNDEARSKAIADAQSKAQELSKELGVSLGSITTFSENTGGYPMPIAFAAMAAGASSNASAPAAAVPAGQQKVTDNVTITYEIH